jgi:hypothetical protein
MLSLFVVLVVIDAVIALGVLISNGDIRRKHSPHLQLCDLLVMLYGALDDCFPISSGLVFSSLNPVDSRWRGE